MEIQGWKYYNHAAVPSCPPHEEPDLKPVWNNSVWKIGGGIPLLARWTTDFDCGYETGWWYVIKDTRFDISTLKAKRRYEINKGKKYFDVREINPVNYIDELYQVTVSAYSQWPKKYRPQVNETDFRNNIPEWRKSVIFGGFEKETQKLCGYAILNETDYHTDFNVLRVNPYHERNAINAAMVNGILEKYNDRFGDGFYVNDGTRAIRHETAFQDYLEKYFGFRKAYCKLGIKYRFPLGIAVKMMYPLRKKINKDSSLGNRISAILCMEEIRKGCGLGVKYE